MKKRRKSIDFEIIDLIDDGNYELIFKKYFNSSDYQRIVLNYTKGSEFVFFAKKADNVVLNELNIVNDKYIELSFNQELFVKLTKKSILMIIDKFISKGSYYELNKLYNKTYLIDEYKNYINKKIKSINNPADLYIDNKFYNDENNADLSFYPGDEKVYEMILNLNDPYLWIKSINKIKNLTKSSFNICKYLETSDKIDVINKEKFKLYLGVYYDSKYLNEFKNFETLFLAIHLCDNKGIHGTLLNDLYQKFGEDKIKNYHDKIDEKLLEKVFKK